MKGPFLHRRISSLFLKILKGMLARKASHEDLFKKITLSQEEAPSDAISIIAPTPYLKTDSITLKVLSERLGITGPLAQELERWPSKPNVRGANPWGVSKEKDKKTEKKNKNKK